MRKEKSLVFQKLRKAHSPTAHCNYEYWYIAQKPYQPYPLSLAMMYSLCCTIMWIRCDKSDHHSHDLEPYLLLSFPTQLPVTHPPPLSVILPSRQLLLLLNLVDYVSVHPKGVHICGLIPRPSVWYWGSYWESGNKTMLQYIERSRLKILVV